MMAAGRAIHAEGVRDLDIQEWVQAQYNFVPHPYWIRHCKELYLSQPPDTDEPRPTWHGCPVSRRRPIKKALRHFGLLRDEPESNAC